MKASQMLVALAALVAATSSHADSPEPGAKPAPTQGAYVFLDLAPITTVTAHFQCSATVSPVCATPTRVDYRNKNTFRDVPSVEGGIGYTFNRYVGIETAFGYVSGGDNQRDDTYINSVLFLDAAFTASVAVRADLPITRNVSLYAKYGIGRQWASMTYDEQGLGDPTFTGNPTGMFHQTFDGQYRPMSVGVSFQTAGAGNYRLAYMRHSSVGSFSYNAIVFGVDWAWVSTWR